MNGKTPGKLKERAARSSKFGFWLVSSVNDPNGQHKVPKSKECPETHILPVFQLHRIEVRRSTSELYLTLRGCSERLPPTLPDAEVLTVIASPI